MSAPALSPAQIHALFDILTHYETYAQIETFKWPDAIHHFGPPFSMKGSQSSSPLLQMLVNKFIVSIPGIRSLLPDFWQERLEVIVSKLGGAELSESYDKGTMGTRKTLATASTSLVEWLVRGCLGGYARQQTKALNHNYDMSNAEDIMRAWDDAAQELVYGNLIEELFDQITESERLEDKSVQVQAAVEYLLILGASFLHHIFVLLPDGQYLLKLIENVNKLVPYMAIRQILRAGNAATMINGMLKIFLAKLSVTSFTNWAGLSKNTDTGMNLLQRIISTVLTWDNSEFRECAAKIEKSKDGPSKEHLNAIKSHIQKSRIEHEKLRSISIEQSKSAVAVIFESVTPPLSTSLSDSQHTQALEYYSALLSIRDREELIKVFCRQDPDLFTPSIREMVAAYDPIIRQVHNGVDLSTRLTDVQNFLDELIKMSKVKTAGNGGGNGQAPSVEDYVNLFRKHSPSYLRFLHQVAKNCPGVANTFREYAKGAISGFRVRPTDGNGAGGTMTGPLIALFSALPKTDKAGVLKALDAHSAYLVSLNTFSIARTQSVLDNNSVTIYGPGMYLARWHGLLDETLITPATAHGPVRRGKDVKYKEGKGKVQVGGKMAWDSEAIGREAMEELPEPPDVSIVVKVLGEQFRGVLKGGETKGHTKRQSLTKA